MPILSNPSTLINRKSIAQTFHVSSALTRELARHVQSTDTHVRIVADNSRKPAGLMGTFVLQPAEPGLRIAEDVVRRAGATHS